MEEEDQKEEDQEEEDYEEPQVFLWGWLGWFSLLLPWAS